MVWRRVKEIPMSDEPDAYQSYLLRLWRAKRKGEWQWYASLESPSTGERQWFPSLAQAFTYLNEQCERQVPEHPEGPGT
jgi:hypothetical protein